MVDKSIPVKIDTVLGCLSERGVLFLYDLVFERAHRSHKKQGAGKNGGKTVKGGGGGTWIYGCMKINN